MTEKRPLQSLRMKDKWQEPGHRERVEAGYGRFLKRRLIELSTKNKEQGAPLADAPSCVIRREDTSTQGCLTPPRTTTGAEHVLPGGGL